MFLPVSSILMVMVAASTVYGYPPTTNQIQCPEICADIYMPVCGSDKKTYSSDCHLLAAACREGSSSLRKISDGECAECQRFCPMHYAPVCGSDGTTYSNACTFNVAKCRDPSLTSRGVGPCLEPVPHNACPNGCPKYYEPVCGSDGTTYANDCMLQAVTCKNPDVTLSHVGPCDKCRRNCPKHFKPVCGSNGVTYANLCLLNIITCEDPSVTLAKTGRC